MARRNVWFTQTNFRYGNSLFLPYSVGLLQAYASQFDEIRSAYTFRGFVVEREPVQDVLERMRKAPPDVFGCSMYIWNYNYQTVLAMAVKKEFPNCLLVYGGPHVPMVLSADWWQKHPYVGVVVHHEGEEAFTNILRQLLEGTVKREWDVNRIVDLSKLPSPYITNVFDEIMAEQRYSDINWDMTSETNRGCPYSCTYCDWGDAIHQKVRRFDEKRIYDEYEWAARRKIALLYNADANYGIFERDIALTDQLVTTKRQFGFPREFRAAYAKNSNERIFQIASTLNNAGMEKGVTLSFQSLDQGTLQFIKRKNMKMNDFSSLIRQYRTAAIPTYTELIIPLPGETYDSFCGGINTLLDAGQHDSINVYPCMILPNAEMANSSYMKMFGLKTVVIPELLDHTVPTGDEYQEQKEIVYETKSMPKEDWQRAYAFSAIVQAFHSMGLTQHSAIFCRTFGISYLEFYQKLIARGESAEDSTPLKAAVLSVRGATERVVAGGPWNQTLPRFNTVTWTPEEVAFLNIAGIAEEREAFYRDLVLFLRQLLAEHDVALEQSILDDFLAYQNAIVSSPAYEKQFTKEFAVDWPGFFATAPEEARIETVPVHVQFIHRDGYGNDLERWSREVAWWHRKDSGWRARTERLV